MSMNVLDVQKPDLPPQPQAFRPNGEVAGQELDPALRHELPQGVERETRRPDELSNGAGTYARTYQELVQRAVENVLFDAVHQSSTVKRAYEDIPARMDMTVDLREDEAFVVAIRPL
jgi:hypothetical protein